LKLDFSQPLGLPEGTVRAALALMAMATACHSFITTGTITVELVAFTAPIITFYFVARGQESQAAPTPDADEPLDQPYAFGVDDRDE
jgi:hypothetical protein